MKFVAYILLAVVVFSILLNPFIELFSEFNDRCRIGAAMKVSYRDAVLASADENALRDIQGEIKTDTFAEDFIDNFCISLDLEKKSPAYADTVILESKNEKYNDFEVTMDWIDKNQCEIEVKTAYKFKTAMFKRFLGETAKTYPTYIVLKRRQALTVEN